MICEDGVAEELRILRGERRLKLREERRSLRTGVRLVEDVQKEGDSGDGRGWDDQGGNYT
jgi:hypothetical protein